MNKEITIYELLGLIKDGQAPKKIKYKGKIYEYIFQNGYTHKDGFSSQYFISDFCADYEKDLNDKVEIIEEDNKIKKLDDLSLKLSTGNCEIIEFKRTLCKYNFTDILKEKDKEIERLNNIINRIYNFVDRTIEVIKQQPSEDDTWILDNLHSIKYLLQGSDKE